MYCEYFIEKIQNTEISSEKMQFFGEFYIANFGLIQKFHTVFGVRKHEEDDFDQLCFFALIDAIDCYEEGRNSFLSYFRRSVLHRYFMYRLEMNYPMRVGKRYYQDVKQNAPISCNLDSCLQGYYKMDEAFRTIESGTVSTAIWEIVKSRVSATEYRILVMRFCGQLKFREIGEVMGFTETQIKTKKNNAFRKLRNNKNLIGIARDFYGIGL